jgi:hypothetical protein
MVSVKCASAHPNNFICSPMTVPVGQIGSVFFLGFEPECTSVQAAAYTDEGSTTKM